MADYDDGCRVKSISTKCPTKKSRTSSSLPISRRENASVSRRHSRRYSKSLAKTCKSGSHRPVAPRSRIHAWPEMNHIEAKVLDFVTKLYPDIFFNLENYCASNRDYMDRTIARFDREVQFYV